MSGSSVHDTNLWTPVLVWIESQIGPILHLLLTRCITLYNFHFHIIDFVHFHSASMSTRHLLFCFFYRGFNGLLSVCLKRVDDVIFGIGSQCGCQLNEMGVWGAAAHCVAIFLCCEIWNVINLPEKSLLWNSFYNCSGLKTTVRVWAMCRILGHG